MIKPYTRGSVRKYRKGYWPNGRKKLWKGHEKIVRAENVLNTMDSSSLFPSTVNISEDHRFPQHIPQYALDHERQIAMMRQAQCRPMLVFADEQRRRAANQAQTNLTGIFGSVVGSLFGQRLGDYLK